MGVVEVLNKISTSMDALYDFVVSDEFLSKDFETYLEKNEIEITKQSQLNDVLTEYLFDKKTQTGERVLDYYKKNYNPDEEIVEAFKGSFRSIFQIKKIAKNAYDVYSLVNEKEFTLVSLINTMNLRSIGRYDFINARIVELKGTYYILEITDVIGSNSEYNAKIEAVKMLIQKPCMLFWDNKEKEGELKAESEKIYSKFIEMFKKDTVITTNTLTDDLLKGFSAFYNGEKVDCSELVKMPKKYEFFEIKEFDEDEDFLSNAAKGFSSHNEIYDIGLFVDKDLGLFVVPFLGTFEEIFKNKEKPKNWENCILEFLLNDKIPFSLIKRQNNALEIINSAFKEKNLPVFKTIDEICKNFKGDNCMSSTMALYNSKLFSELGGF